MEEYDLVVSRINIPPIINIAESLEKWGFLIKAFQYACSIYIKGKANTILSKPIFISFFNMTGYFRFLEDNS